MGGPPARRAPPRDTEGCEHRTRSQCFSTVKPKPDHRRADTCLKVHVFQGQTFWAIPADEATEDLDWGWFVGSPSLCGRTGRFVWSPPVCGGGNIRSPSGCQVGWGARGKAAAGVGDAAAHAQAAAARWLRTRKPAEEAGVRPGNSEDASPERLRERRARSGGPTGSRRAAGGRGARLLQPGAESGAELVIPWSHCAAIVSASHSPGHVSVRVRPVCSSSSCAGVCPRGRSTEDAAVRPSGRENQGEA